MEAFMLPVDLRRFREHRAVGQITFFRVAICPVCKGEMAKNHARYCSKRCFLLAKEIGMDGKRWDEAMAELFGKKIQIETTDGMYLSGKLTQIGTTPLDVGGETVQLPDFLELDADAEKRVNIERLKAIKAV